MSLIYDRRSTIGSAPAVHALVIGVGDYGLPELRLSSAVKSAVAVAEWVLTHNGQLAVPVGTCRALLSPIPAAGDLSHAEDSPSPATTDAILSAASEWRADAMKHRDNVTLFYFCGQGFQRSTTEDLMLFRDFGSGVGPALRGAVAVDNIFRGMAPHYGDGADIARTQLYFIDTDRTQPRSERYEVSRPTQIFDEFSSGPDDRSAVIFYATGPGQHAWAKVDEVSIFASALLRCLDGAAAVALDNSLQRWGVTVNSLIQGLRRIMEKNSDALPVTQAPVVGGLVRDHVIRYLDAPPVTDLVINLVNVKAASTVFMQDPSGVVVYKCDVGASNSARIAAKSGFYFIRAEAKDGTQSASTIANVQPGTAEIELVMP